MKTFPAMATIVCLLVLALPVSGHAFGPRPQAPPESKRTEVLTNVSSSAAAISLGAIHDRISAANGFGGGAGTGMASGNAPLGIGVWAAGAGLNFSGSQPDTQFRGNLFSGMLGVDKQAGSLLVGVALGAENLDLATKYNSGSIAYDGLSVIPYLSYAIQKDLLVDASFGYTSLFYTIRETQRDENPSLYPDTKPTGHTSADRLVSSVGITKYLTLDKLLLSGRLGTMYLNESKSSYSLDTLSYGSTDIYVWQGSFALRAAYDLGAFKPTAGLTYTQDFSRSGRKSDVWGTDLDLGFSYALNDRCVLGLSGIFGLREDLTKAGGMLSLRYDF